MDPCAFCAIVAGREPASVVLADEAIIAFLDIRPVNPGHLLVVPRIAGDGFRIQAGFLQPDRAELDATAARLRSSLTGQSPDDWQDVAP